MNSAEDGVVQKLNEFNDILKEKDLLKEILNPQSQHKLEEIAAYISPESDLNKIIQTVSSSGDVETYDWKLIRTFILYKIKETILGMQASYPDFRDRPGETFNSQLENILQSFMVFEDKYLRIILPPKNNRAPFTIQRICEIISNPRKFYKSTKKLLFAIEKCVNITPQGNS